VRRFVLCRSVIAANVLSFVGVPCRNTWTLSLHANLHRPSPFTSSVLAKSSHLFELRAVADEIGNTLKGFPAPCIERIAFGGTHA